MNAEKRDPHNPYGRELEEAIRLDLDLIKQLKESLAAVTAEVELLREKVKEPWKLLKEQGFKVDLDSSKMKSDPHFFCCDACTRKLIVVMAMKTLRPISTIYNEYYAIAARHCIRMADTLLAELEKEKQQ